MMAITGELMESPALVLPAEQAYVTEMATGLRFHPDTPVSVWGCLVVRLQRQQKLIEWALADAINFGEAAYGEMYAQWVDETGLTKRTLQNIAYIGRKIEPPRRREHVSFAHHAEVVALPVPDQESLLDAAESRGMTRYDLRDAVRELKASRAGRAVDASGTAIEESEPLVWTAQKDDLTDEMRTVLETRLAGVGKSYAIGYERAWLDCLVYRHDEEAFKPGRWRL